MNNIHIHALLLFVLAITFPSNSFRYRYEITNKLELNQPKIDTDAFECYPDFTNDELFLRCRWTQLSCVITFHFCDTQTKHIYKYARAIAKGTQTLCFDVRKLPIGPYKLIIAGDACQGLQPLHFVKVE